MTRSRVLFASPVQQKPQVLTHFLDGLKRQDSEEVELDFLFVDDNHDAASSELLARFAAEVPGASVHRITPAERYQRDEFTHWWNESLIWRVAAVKDAIIEHALENGYDHLFLADSDLVLRRGTVAHMVRLDEAIVSQVFWTRWTPEEPLMPQVWLSDHYEMAFRDRFETLTPSETSRRQQLFLDMLALPGTYDVGGLGACTLISREALERGARFAEIPNVSFWGEDRHFCIRAMALGLRLRADTQLAPLHLYRESELWRVPDFVALDAPMRETVGVR